MDGSQEFDNKLSYFENEITSLKTATVKSASTIATTEKTVNVSYTLKGLEPAPYIQSATGRQNAIIALSGEGNFISAVYVDGVGTNYDNRVLDIQRINNNRYKAVLYSMRQSDIDSLNAGGDVKANYILRVIASSDCDVNVSYENNTLGV